MRNLIGLISVLALVSEAHADELFENFRSIRAMGMGNAYLAVVKDGESLFYNPAALARVRGINWQVGDLNLGVNGTKAYAIAQDLSSAGSFAQALSKHYGDHVWVGAQAQSIFSMPYFGAGVYGGLDAGMNINSPSYTNLDVSYIQDIGYTMGGAIPLLPTVQLGTALRYVRRTGARQNYAGSFVSTLDPATIQNDFNRTGVGYAMDLGLNVIAPGPVSPVFSFVWKNVGVTKYKMSNVTMAGPPSDLDEMSAGVALGIDAGFASVTPAIDFKYINRADIQLGKKLHLGVEIGLPVLDIRAGFNEGYYTLGVGLNLGLVRIDAATYGVELGEYPGQLEDRRYMAQITMEIGIDWGFGGSAGSAANSGSDSKGGSSSSMWGGRKLKRRR